MGSGHHEERKGRGSGGRPCEQWPQSLNFTEMKIGYTGEGDMTIIPLRLTAIWTWLWLTARPPRCLRQDPGSPGQPRRLRCRCLGPLRGFDPIGVLTPRPLPLRGGSSSLRRFQRGGAGGIETYSLLFQKQNCVNTQSNLWRKEKKMENCKKSMLIGTQRQRSRCR